LLHRYVELRAGHGDHVAHPERRHPARSPRVRNTRTAMTTDNPLRRSRSTKRVFAVVLVLSLLVAVLTLAGPAAASVVFSDGFESGNLAAWTGSTGMTVQPDVVFAGTYAARATSTTGTSAYAYKALQTPLTDLYYDGRFNFVSAGNNNVSV